MDFFFFFFITATAYARKEEIIVQANDCLKHIFENLKISMCPALFERNHSWWFPIDLFSGEDDGESGCGQCDTEQPFNCGRRPGAGSPTGASTDESYPHVVPPSQRGLGP